MDKAHYNELVSNLNHLIDEKVLDKKKIFLFGHCNATEVLADELMQRGIEPAAILDNNKAKYSMEYKGIKICSPDVVMSFAANDIIVLIAARAYAPMAKQLRAFGFEGQIEKIVDYNSFADYSISPETIRKMTERLHRGQTAAEQHKKSYPGAFRFYCPFQALGDIYLMMSYLPFYLEKRSIKDYVVFTVGNACADVVRMFGGKAEGLSQKEIDEEIQAVIFEHDDTAFIPHQDRPYVNKLYKALYYKFIPLETIYKCGVFGLPGDTVPVRPQNLRKYSKLDLIAEGKSVILSPYAKSVSNIPDFIWENYIKEYKEKGYEIFTNVAGDEEALSGTKALKVPLSEMQSVVKMAGTFIGIRSGLCDVIRDANCRKIAIYPDAFYSDTKWKMVDMYRLDGWENIVIN